MAKGSQKKIKAFWSELMNTHLPDYAPYVEKMIICSTVKKPGGIQRTHGAFNHFFAIQNIPTSFD